MTKRIEIINLKKLLCIKQDFEHILTVGNEYISTEETEEEYGVETNENFYWIKKFLFKEIK